MHIYVEYIWLSSLVSKYWVFTEYLLDTVYTTIAMTVSWYSVLQYFQSIHVAQTQNNPIGPAVFAKIEKTILVGNRGLAITVVTHHFFDLKFLSGC